jgi:PAS domain S-box-containing protein
MDKKLHLVASELSPAQALRQHAEMMVSGKVIATTEELMAMSPQMVLKLLHELQVHQIELEMQNEELRKMQLKLEAVNARYFDLYDLAPISYCTVSETGVITEANLAVAQLLGESRSQLVGKNMTSYIDKEHQDEFYLCRKILELKGGQQGCELHLKRQDGASVWVYLSMTASIDSQNKMLQRMVLTDVTNSKTLALAMRQSEAHLRRAAH